MPSALVRQSLIDAINKTDLYTVILILAHRKLSNEDINSSLLHLAASQGNVTILQLLLWVKKTANQFFRKFRFINSKLLFLSVWCRCIHR
jgi:predicted membrane protein